MKNSVFIKGIEQDGAEVGHTQVRIELDLSKNPEWFIIRVAITKKKRENLKTSWG